MKSHRRLPWAFCIKKTKTMIFVFRQATDRLATRLTSTPSSNDQKATASVVWPHHTAQRRDKDKPARLSLWKGCVYLFIYLFIDLLKAYSPVNRTGSPQGFFTKSNFEYNAKSAHFSNVKHIIRIRKLVSSVLLS